MLKLVQKVRDEAFGMSSGMFVQPIETPLMRQTMSACGATRVLDCTLRDGGYYNGWRFDPELAESLVASLNAAGVDIIEVGFKTPAEKVDDDCAGLYRFCSESQLDFLRRYRNAEYAFMINTAEFMDGGRASREMIERCIYPARDSLFSWARIATHLDTFDSALVQAKWLSAMGYRVALNLMGMSLLSDDDIRRALARVDDDVVDVFYFADSFGSLEARDIVHYVNLIRSYYGGAIGLHAHDNQGLAFSNALQAISHRVEFVDATVTGMGRGAGNLRTEQLLLALKKNDPALNPAELLPVIERWLAPMQREYGWGWDYTYMMSAIENIHPVYCQTLRSIDQYSKEQVTEILASIAPESRRKFDRASLAQAIDGTVNVDVAHEDDVALDTFEIQPADEVLIVGGGKTSIDYRQALGQFIAERQPLVVECNPADAVLGARAERYVQAVLNWVRLERLLRAGGTSETLVTGVAALPRVFACQRRLIKHMPYRILHDEFSVQGQQLVLPDYDVGMFALGIASLASPKRIFLAGFDGFVANEGDDRDRLALPQQQMDAFWPLVTARLNSEIVSLTPTRYALPTQSIYGFLK